MYIGMAGGRGAQSGIYTVKFHVPCVLGSEATAFRVDSSWKQACLLSVASIEIAGYTPTGAIGVVSCSDLKPLHAVTAATGSDQEAALIRTLSVRRDYRPPSRIPLRTTAAPQPTITAQLWVELELKVQPNAYLFDSSNPTLCSAWRLLLPWLVSYNRDEAPATPTSRVPELPRSPREERGGSPREARGGSEVRALEAVYASLKPETLGPLWEMDDGGEASSVGAGPGAFGLNAVPAAVIMKGEK